MRIYIDNDSNRIISEPKYKANVSSLAFMRGDASVINLQFTEDFTAQAAVSSREIIFGVKAAGDFDGQYVVSTDTYTIVNNAYKLTPNFNTVALNDLLNSDGLTGNDISSVTCQCQFSWSDGNDEWISSPVINAVISNDLIKNNEDTPLANPSPINWLATAKPIYFGLSAGAYLKNTGTNLGYTFDTTALSGNYNVFIGDQAGYNNTSDQVNAFGYSSANSNTGNDVNAFGYTAGHSNTGSNVNILGYSAGYDNTGNALNALGSSAGWANIGNNVNALGTDAAHGNSGSDLNALGYFAGYDNAGSNVNSLGSYAGWTNIGSDCNFVGSDSGYNNSGNNVNALGITSGYNNAGSYNIFIGSNTATSPTSLSGCIVLGSFATAISSNQLALGSTTVPLLTSGSGAASGLYLVVNVNGTNFKLPLYI